MAALSAAQAQHAARGIVLKADGEHRRLVVSCDAIPGYMDAMEMEFRVRDAKALAGVNTGATVSFTVVEQGKDLLAESVKLLPASVVEPEPMNAGGLSALDRALHPEARPLATGEAVPDFSLTDQSGQTVRLSDLRGKVIALTFGYSRCPNPNYCYRLSSNLAHVERRLHGSAGKDLVFLTIAIDPDHDQGQVLKDYAAAFKADPSEWHFLTGPLPEIQRIAACFGMNFWSQEGLITHSLRTAILDRQGRLAVNLEGNQFTERQLADLVQTVMQR
jgi:protein SCO1/2